LPACFGQSVIAGNPAGKDACAPRQFALPFSEGRSGQAIFAAGKVELAFLQAQNDRFTRSFAEAERIFRNVIDSLFDCEPSKASQKWMPK
jgi:hypothetical protein